MQSTSGIKYVRKVFVFSLVKWRSGESVQSNTQSKVLLKFYSFEKQFVCIFRVTSVI